MAHDARKDPAAALQLAATRYLKAKGWNVLLIGEVEIRTWPSQLTAPLRTVAVRFMGAKPSIVQAQTANRRERATTDPEVKKF